MLNTPPKLHAVSTPPNSLSPQLSPTSTFSLISSLQHRGSVHAKSINQAHPLSKTAGVDLFDFEVEVSCERQGHLPRRVLRDSCEGLAVVDAEALLVSFDHPACLIPRRCRSRPFSIFTSIRLLGRWWSLDVGGLWMGNCGPGSVLL